MVQINIPAALKMRAPETGKDVYQVCVIRNQALNVFDSPVTEYYANTRNQISYLLELHPFKKDGKYILA